MELRPKPTAARQEQLLLPGVAAEMRLCNQHLKNWSYIGCMMEGLQCSQLPLLFLQPLQADCLGYDADVLCKVSGYAAGVLTVCCRRID